jgi:hypothetical protein
VREWPGVYEEIGSDCNGAMRAGERIGQGGDEGRESVVEGGSVREEAMISIEK